MKPLLAAKSEGEDLSTLPFPMIGSEKIDGIRCLITTEGPQPRSLEDLIPNEFIRRELSRLPVGLDGELITFTNGEVDHLNTVSSKVRKSTGEPDFAFYVFDHFMHEKPYEERLEILEWEVSKLNDPRVRCVPTFPVADADEAQAKAKEVISRGGEGIMLRRKDGPYKWGRSSFKQAILVKIKAFEDDEAELIGMVEAMKNTNVAEKGALGQTKRSSAKAGKVPKGEMGALVLSWRGTEFEIGTGFTAQQRKDFWKKREALTGRLVKFRFSGIGSKGRPLCPRFHGFRDTFDL